MEVSEWDAKIDDIVGGGLEEICLEECILRIVRFSVDGFAGSCCSTMGRGERIKVDAQRQRHCKRFSQSTFASSYMMLLFTPKLGYLALVLL